jgi:hypothetical protein
MIYRVTLEAKGYSAKAYEVVATSDQSAVNAAILLWDVDHPHQYLGGPYVLDVRKGNQA